MFSLAHIHNNIIYFQIVNDKACPKQYNSHMKGHVFRNTVSIAICDVMDGTDSHDHLANGVHYGQVHDSPVKCRDEG